MKLAQTYQYYINSLPAHIAPAELKENRKSVNYQHGQSPPQKPKKNSKIDMTLEINKKILRSGNSSLQTTDRQRNSINLHAQRANSLQPKKIKLHI